MVPLHLSVSNVAGLQPIESHIDQDPSRENNVWLIILRGMQTSAAQGSQRTCSTVRLWLPLHTR
jgi:hypothetical protein